MFAALAVIASHLRDVPQFQTWAVRDGLTADSRQAERLVDVRYDGATVGDAQGASSVNVSPVLVVSLSVARGDDAARDLDSAFSAAIKALHGYLVPGATSTKDKWTALKLQQVRVFDPLDSLLGCSLIFVHSKRFAVGTCGAC